MRRLPVLLSAVLLFALTIGSSRVIAQQPPGSSQPPSGPPPLSFSALIDQTLAMFPRVQGDVVEVQGRSVVLSAGRGAGALPGLALEVYREGREIKHPRTGQVLGRAEESIGTATVTRVFDGYSTADFSGSGVAPGDRIRTPTGKTRVTLLSLTSPGVRDLLVEAATSEVYDGLNRSGRFTVQLGEQLTPWLRQQGVTPEDLLGGRRVADALRTFKVDNLLVMHFKIVEKKPYMDVRLFTAERTDAALSTSMFVPSSVKPVQPGRFSTADRNQPQVAERKQRSLLARLLGGDLESGKYSAGEASIPLVEVGRVDFVVVSLDVSVGPADKIPRVVLTDGDRIFVYRIENRALVPEWTFNTRSLGQVFSVQFVDLAGDGTLQVAANRFDHRLGMSSVIVGMKGGKAAPLVDHIDALLLAFDEKGTGVRQSLWLQPYSPDTFFTKGRADRVVLRNGALVRENSAIVPENFRLTGATMASFTKDQRVLAYIDEQNRLRITSGGDEIWSSSSQVGGGAPKIEVQRFIERGGRSYFYQLEQVPLAIDLDGDGVQEVIVPQNQIEGMLAVIYRGPAGLRMQQINSGFEGMIAGIGGFPSDDGSPPSLVSAVVRYKNVLRTSGSTQIIMTVPE